MNSSFLTLNPKPNISYIDTTLHKYTLTLLWYIFLSIFSENHVAGALVVLPSLAQRGFFASFRHEASLLVLVWYIIELFKTSRKDAIKFPLKYRLIFLLFCFGMPSDTFFRIKLLMLGTMGLQMASYIIRYIFFHCTEIDRHQVFAFLWRIVLFYIATYGFDYWVTC